MDLLTLALLKKFNSGGGGDTSPLLAKINANTKSISNLNQSVESIEKRFDLYPTKEDLESGAVPIMVKIATAENTGTVKSSDDINKISVNEDGTMNVNSVSVGKLVQADDDYIIMDGGSADASL